jgi:hypothetical protein
VISTDRRTLSAIFLGAVGTLLSRGVSEAQFTEQEVRNGASVVSTGDVDINQSASGTQTVNGTVVSGPGVYETPSGRVVVRNDGSVVSTGDVSINQAASGSQTVSVQRVYEGMQGQTCSPGHVLADPHTGVLFFQREDCCYYEVPCCWECSDGSCDDACEGDFCG